MASAVAQLDGNDHQHQGKRHDIRGDERPIDEREAVDEPERDADGERHRPGERDSARFARANDLDRLRQPAHRGEDGPDHADEIDESCVHGAVISPIRSRIHDSEFMFSPQVWFERHNAGSNALLRKFRLAAVTMAL